MKFLSHDIIARRPERDGSVCFGRREILCRNPRDAAERERHPLRDVCVRRLGFREVAVDRASGAFIPSIRFFFASTLPVRRLT